MREAVKWRLLVIAAFLTYTAIANESLYWLIWATFKGQSWHMLIMAYVLLLVVPYGFLEVAIHAFDARQSRARMDTVRHRCRRGRNRIPLLEEP